MSDTVSRIDSSPTAGPEERTHRLRLAGRLSSEGKHFRLIDLFCGAGGLTLGFTEAFGHAFIPVLSNDFNAFAAQTYNARFGDHCTVGDIVHRLDDFVSEIPKAHVVVGGPPCQGFSLLNKNRGDDDRKALWRPFLEVVKRAEAEVFLMENVPQLLGSAEHEAIIEEASALGYATAWATLCAADYGVPQVRRRAFVLGSRRANPNSVFPPKKTHYDPNTTITDRTGYASNPSPWRTVRDAMADLPPPEGTRIRDLPPPLDLHFGRTPTPLSRERYRAIPQEGMNRFDLQRNAPELTPACWLRKKSGGTDLFGRLWWDRPSVTIRTEFFKPEKGRYLHPEQHRPITHREAARLQSFPDTFRFYGSKIEIARQIGNAVPPLLAARLADSVYALLTENEEEQP